MAVEAIRHGYTIIDVIDKVLDKGLVINADISVSLAGTELLGIRIKAAIASFETAAKYGLEFPAGARLDTAAWREALAPKEDCPMCSRPHPREDLLKKGCPWCGWSKKAAKSRRTIT